MEINITQFYNEANPANYSASVVELGQDAGIITWQAAKEADFMLLDTAEKLEAMRAWARSSGGWNEAEIAAWPDVELNALFIQLVSGDMREMVGTSWEEYEANENGGHSLFRGGDGQIYYYLED